MPEQNNSSPADIASRARAFALTAHGEQRYGDQPYAVHLDAVAALLAPFGETAQAIGYLHDVIEDTPVPLQAVREAFGDLIADCVALVNRAERKTHTNAKLAKVSGDTELALIVKAADRLANLRTSARAQGDSKLDMYRREHPTFRAAAFRPGLCDALWMEMEQILAARPRA